MKLSRRFKRVASALLAVTMAFVMTFSTDVMPMADSKQDQLKAEVEAKQAELDKVNITVVVVTHEHELVHKLARKYNNRVIELANGMVASDTSHPEVARRYAARMAERENGYDDYEDYDDEE